MDVYKKFVLKHSIEIEAPPEKLWDFFHNIEKNYKIWHPETIFSSMDKRKSTRSWVNNLFRTKDGRRACKAQRYLY